MVARQPGQVSNLDEYVTKGTWRSSGSIRSERQLGGQKGARLHLGVPLVVRPATRRVQESRSPLMTRHATLTSLRLILAFCRMMASVTIWAVASGKQTSKRIAGWWPVTPSTLSRRCLTTSECWKQHLVVSSPHALMTNFVARLNSSSSCLNCWQMTAYAGGRMRARLLFVRSHLAHVVARN